MCDICLLKLLFYIYVNVFFKFIFYIYIIMYILIDRGSCNEREVNY